MKLGITSIQRNRNPWIVEWLAFHMMVGFNQFYIYSHKCTDGMTHTLLRLANHYPIVVHQLELENLPQLVAYQHSVNTYLNEVDWMAFIDGDEFLFSTQYSQVSEALVAYEDKPLSALAAYWLCYGSSGHIDEPEGLIIQNYPRHSRRDFSPNRHIKSILRGREKATVYISHLFQTEQGTFDELLRPINHGWMKDLEPSYEVFRINHYMIQSYQFFRTIKQHIGAADANPNLVRPEEWYFEHDRNECDDGISYNFLVPLKLKVREMLEVIAEK